MFLSVSVSVPVPVSVSECGGQYGKDLAVVLGKVLAVRLEDVVELLAIAGVRVRVCVCMRACACACACAQG